MSMSFDEPVNNAALKRIFELFGEPVSLGNRRKLLFNNMNEVNQKDMKEIANLAGQPVMVGVHSLGEIVEMSDGTRYQVTEKGWRKLTT